MVGPQLRVLFGEAGEPLLTGVGQAIAIGVGQPADLAREGDHQPAPPGRQAGHEGELIGKHRGRLITAVAIGVGQSHDP